MEELSISAEVKNLPGVISFIRRQLEAVGCGEMEMLQMELTAEEVFVNIASYAYDPEVGPATVRVETEEHPPSVVVSFTDQGRPYNPLMRKDPNIHLPVSQRRRGGLGVYLVKQYMDDVDYQYRDGRNILTMRKNL